MTPAELEAIRTRVEQAEELPDPDMLAKIDPFLSPDERFLAHSRTDVPALLAHVAELREAVRALLSALNKSTPLVHTIDDDAACPSCVENYDVKARARRVLGEGEL